MQYFSTWMVFVYNVEDDLNVRPVSEQSFGQVWSDLKTETSKRKCRQRHHEIILRAEVEDTL